MAAIPEFILRKLVVPGSLITQSGSFSFKLRNNFAPVTITRAGVAVNGQPAAAGSVAFQPEGGSARQADSISETAPFGLPVGSVVQVTVNTRLGGGKIQMDVDTREAGNLKFSFSPKGGGLLKRKPRSSGYSFGSRMLMGVYQAEAVLDSAAVIGEINPWIYGHFIEHLERCIYGGLWTEDGASLREDTLKLARSLKPSLIRYPGGNFASGYHWEDGIGPKDKRPRRFDPAWQAWESNQVGTAEYIDLCRKTGAEPFLVVNDGSGTPDEASRWVKYCNAPAGVEGGQLRAAHGHPDPFNVRLWGVGNEVWGRWQVGHTTAAAYAARLREFAAAMRQADPSIKLVGVGQTPFDDSPSDEGFAWNNTVLLRAGEVIDYLSFHIYHPGESGWKEAYDQEALHLALASAGEAARHASYPRARRAFGRVHGGRLRARLRQGRRVRRPERRRRDLYPARSR